MTDNPGNANIISITAPQQSNVEQKESKHSSKKAQLSEETKCMIIDKLLAGMSQSIVATEHGVSQTAISKLFAKFKKYRTVERRKGSGRPRKTSSGDDNLIFSIVQRNHFVTGKELKEELLLSEISERTIRRRISESITQARETKGNM